jgi:trk system potassium uptake protein TrkH
MTGAGAHGRTAPRLGVDVRAAFGVVGGLLKWFSLAFLAPAAIALTGDGSPLPFLVPAAAALSAGRTLERLAPGRELLGGREAFLVVAALWVLVPAFGAVPYVIDGAARLDRPIDAYFEAVSGFTATGATVLTDFDAAGRALLFWRQLTHWLGGMGIIVLAVAVLPRLRVGGRDLLLSELPGPADVQPLVATVRDTAKRLWKVYVGITAVGLLLLAATGWLGLEGGMGLFDAFSYATSAVSLGGFAPEPSSAQAFGPAAQWVLCAIMLVSGLNFLRLYRVLARGHARAVTGDAETRLYFALCLAAAVVIAGELLARGTFDGLAAIRPALFQAISVMTTTGLATADWTAWGPIAALTLLALMFVGASSGSPTGSIKVVRHLILARLARRELEQAIHPGAVVPVRVGPRPVDERVVRSAVMFVLLYAFVFALGAFGLAFDSELADGADGVFDAIGAAAACLGNVGPAFGAVGPFGSYAGLGDGSTAILIVLMLLGRIEIIPLAVLFTRSFWRL